MRNDAGTARIREMCDYIAAHADEPLSLADLAARAGVTSFHLQRSFKAVVGVSPKQYLDDCRMRKFKGLLREGSADGVTGAIYQAGFGASSRLYEKVDTRLGMTPMEYRSGGEGVDIAYAADETPPPCCSGARESHQVRFCRKSEIQLMAGRESGALRRARAK